MPPRGSPSPRRPYRGNPLSPRGGSSRGRYQGSVNSSPSSPSSGSERGRGRGRGGASTPRLDQAPRNVCNFYWTTGSCKRGFECTYSHESRPGLHMQQSEHVVDDIDFFSVEGLSINNGSIRSEDQSLKPAEAHNHLKALIRQSIVTPSKASGLVKIFGSVSSRNLHWDRERAQQFLDTVVNGDALLRVGEVLRWSDVRHNVELGTGGSALSFQRGYFPLLEFFASDFVLKTTVHQNINKLFTIIEINYEEIHDTLCAVIPSMIEARSWNNQHVQAMPVGGLDGVTIFKVLSVVLSQFFARFITAIRNHPRLITLVDSLQQWFQTWSERIRVGDFNDPITASRQDVRDLTLEQLVGDISRLRSIVRREFGISEEQRRAPRIKGVSDAHRHESLINQLNQTYDPPGHIRENGPRHDNDHANISDIRIAPTHEELMCEVEPYLPSSVQGAPHHLPVGSMEKHLDRQYRLLREEMLSSMRKSVAAVSADIDVIVSPPSSRRRSPTTLEHILHSHGGPYRSTGLDSVFFHVYTGAQFMPSKAEQRSFSVGIRVDTPPGGAARHPQSKNRAEYWEHSKKLSSGSLIALVLVTTRCTKIFLGTVASNSKDIAESAKAGADTIELSVSFFDTEVELLALRTGLSRLGDETIRYSFVVDNSIMFESVRPFLDTLCSTEPTSIPFSTYLAREDQLVNVPVSAPRYSRVPSFGFNLECLTGSPLTLKTGSRSSIAAARVALKRSSSLDDSQADSVVDALTREICLIQGPPGTGKSFTGKELLRVLLANRVKPVLLIAYTNHALDHMLESVLDAKITNKMVRLGSRASNDRIAEYSLWKLEKVGKSSSMQHSIGREFAKMKTAEHEMMAVLESIQAPDVEPRQILSHIDIHYSDAADMLRVPPFWITRLMEMMREEAEENGEWETVQNRKAIRKTQHLPSTPYGFWARCMDFDFLESEPLPNELDERLVFFQALGFQMLPGVPRDNRASLSPDELATTNIWLLSRSDRQRLHRYWIEEVRTHAYQDNLDEFRSLRARYTEICRDYENFKNVARQELLRNTELIGCTTTGAAKLISLLGTVSPKVLIVEEAGQLLESHILAALVPSVDHLICIGDPQQLRPTLSTYRLSMDSESGRSMYKFDQSLMERLATAGAPMSLINVQRRMRPEISHFIRKILYPTLTDHPVVSNYPAVKGMSRNVYFFNHSHQEGGDTDSVSKYNTFEANFIRDLVLYFLKQGSYSGQGDIAVLCAYLGQLQKVRAALSDAKLAVSLDERDAQELERQGQELPSNVFENVQVSKHIRLGTVDTFQGEEAKIVIVSLVRNSGNFSTNAPIGFLKSSNRINVALSRAQHGLYILGNAANLRQNETWSTVLAEMDANEQIGNNLPILCARHQTKPARSIDGPGQLPLVAPEGGCLEQCEYQLKCGHSCKSVCHPDLGQHSRMVCEEPCPRIQCPRQHPCPRLCGQSCGPCVFKIYNVALPCGHTADTVPCYQYDDLSSVKCQADVELAHPSCGHLVKQQCHQDVSKARCMAICGGQRNCCSKKCTARCHSCTALNGKETDGRTIHIHHITHPCDRALFCQHPCGLDCSTDHECNTRCGEKCRQACSHHKCRLTCAEPCPPCMEPCTWSCSHYSCPVPCGSICSRLPCDAGCTKVLLCGHQCPSVCGEPCQAQKCVVCLPKKKKRVIVDFIMQRTLADLDTTSEDTAERIITLICGHVFTVETLDGHCHMSEFYETDPVTGTYISTKTPPTDFQISPMCPTCRGPITSPRYGRVTKRANLDLLETNIAGNMSKSLQSVVAELSAIETTLDTSKTAAKTHPASTAEPDVAGTAVEVLEQRRVHHLNQKKNMEPLSFKHILGPNGLHGLWGGDYAAWKRWITPWKKVYTNAAAIACSRGPQIQTYHAALSTLYRIELSALTEDPTRVVSEPEVIAMGEVDKKIGQPPHKADTKYQVEAWIFCIDIRLKILEIAESRYEGLRLEKSEDRGKWHGLCGFIYASCSTDAEKAIAIANRSSASRQVARCTAISIRISLERTRFQTQYHRDDLAVAGRLTLSERKRLVDILQSDKQKLIASLRNAESLYISVRNCAGNAVLHAEEVRWFATECAGPVNKALDNFEKFIQHILTGSTYQPLSREEKASIVAALDFGYRGHFYNCPNGHTFVITECGGAMQVARCPDCGAEIGGVNHALNSTNTRAMDFEDLARERGGLDPHWAWGQGA